MISQNHMSRKGFTLIELLVVVAIVGLLSTIIIVAYGTSRTRARDAKRLSDMKQFGTALELYNNDNNAYPIGTNIHLGSGNSACLNIDGWQAAGCPDAYIGKVPTDPSPQATPYIYNSSSGTTYTIDTTLEAKTNGLSGRIQQTPTGIIPAP